MSDLLIRVGAEIFDEAFEFEQRERGHDRGGGKTASQPDVIHRAWLARKVEHYRFIAPKRLRRMMPYCGAGVNTKLLNDVLFVVHGFGSLLDEFVGAVRGG